MDQKYPVRYFFITVMTFGYLKFELLYKDLGISLLFFVGFIVVFPGLSLLCRLGFGLVGVRNVVRRAKRIGWISDAMVSFSYYVIGIVLVVSFFAGMWRVSYILSLPEVFVDSGKFYGNAQVIASHNEFMILRVKKDESIEFVVNRGDAGLISVKEDARTLWGSYLMK